MELGFRSVEESGKCYTCFAREQPRRPFDERTLVVVGCNFDPGRRGRFGESVGIPPHPVTYSVLNREQPCDRQKDHA